MDWEEVDAITFDYVQQGQLSKAASALVTELAVKVSAPVIAEMREKHPEARAEDRARKAAVPHIHQNAANQINHECIKKVVLSFPRGSAGGPSGLRPQHLRDAFAHGWEHELTRQLGDFCNKLLKGHVIAEFKPWFFGAKLAALPKPDDTLRPIAVGDTLRRLTSKLALEDTASDLRAYLEPIQVGVGSRFGCERIVHTARQWLGRISHKTDAVLRQWT